MRPLILLTVMLSLFLTSCSTQRNAKMTRSLDTSMESGLLGKQFTGFFLMEAASGDTLYRHLSDKYFIPASNTKIFTLYTALELLPTTLPALKYRQQGDTLYIMGTGDPTLMHPYFHEKAALDFVKQFENPSLVARPAKDLPLGPGWSWADYDTYYSPERSSLPLYGNVVTAYPQEDGQWKLDPGAFSYETLTPSPKFYRLESENHFTLPAAQADTLEVPYKTSTATGRTLLESLLQRTVTTASPEKAAGEWNTIYGQKADSVYKRMMMVSDNFIAEQLLIQASGMLSDTLSSAAARAHVLKGSLADLKHQPRWVDGSGLSRYNLFTPESMVHVLKKIYDNHGLELVKALFPAGGESGTIRNYFKSESGTPYIYAKTGTLSNNFCLSGFLITKKGKVLIFSFMNNHYMGSSIPVKKEMEAVFRFIRDTY